MNKLFVQVERVEDLTGRADNYFTPPETKERKPISNADRIRSMTDKELAEWMETNVTCASCPVDLDVCRNKLQGGMSCKEVLFDWLKSPVREGA